MFDLKIINGMVLDGSGNPAIRTDIGVTGDHIAALGDLQKADAKTILDATGRMVCPGFIDASHSDA